MNRSRVTGDLASHGNIFVDIANDRVGIGSTIPGEKLSLPDSAKIALGNNADLQLYHDTSLSQIVSKDINNFTIRQQAGSGFLFIHGDQLHLRSQSTNEPYFVGTNNGTVQLYYDSSVKFNTAAIGIVVTGTTDTDHLTVSGVSTFSGQSNFNEDIFFLGASSKTITFDKSEGHIRHLDNAKSQFGTQGDLSIYHNGSHSFIDDTGTGNLKLRSNNFRVSNADESKLSATFQASGAAELYHDNAKKFETTNTGAVVTGIITATSRVSLGNNTTNAVDLEFGTNRGSAGDTLANINWKWNNTNVAQIRGMAGSDTTNKDDAHLNFYTAAAGSLVERLRIDSSGRLLIGHTASVPIDGSTNNFRLQVSGTDYATSGITQQRFQNGVSGATLTLAHSRNGTQGNHTILSVNDEYGKIRFYGSDGTNFEGYGAAIVAKVETGIAGDSTPGRLEFHTTASGAQDGTERLRIDSNGHVMIGTTTEGNTNADDLTIANSGEGGITIRSGSSSNGNIFFSDATSGAGEYAGIIDYKHSSDAMTFELMDQKDFASTLMV